MTLKYDASLDPFSEVFAHPRQAVLWLRDRADECQPNFSNYIPFPGITFGDPEVEELDPIYAEQPRVQFGQHYNLQREVAPAIPVRWDFELTFPAGQGLRTKMDKYVRIGSNCRADSYIIPNCVDVCETWVLGFRDVSFKYLTMTAPIVVNDSAESVDFTTMMSGVEPILWLGLRGRTIYEDIDNTPIYHISMCGSDGCGCDNLCDYMVAWARSDDGATQDAIITEDGFETTTIVDLSATLTVNEVVVDSFCDGRRLIITTNNVGVTPPFTIPAQGGGNLYTFGLDSRTLNPITLPEGAASGSTFIRKDKNGFYYLFGSGDSATTNTPTIYRSRTLRDWQIVSQTPIDAANDSIITGVDYDAINDQFIVVGYTTTTNASFVLLVSCGVVQNITAQLDPVPTDLLTAVEWLCDDAILIGDAAGSVWEGSNVSGGGTIQPLINLGANPIQQIEGDLDRHFVVTSLEVYERSITTNSGAFQRLELPQFAAGVDPLFEDASLVQCANSSFGAYQGPNEWYLAARDGQIIRIAPCGDCQFILSLKCFD